MVNRLILETVAIVLASQSDHMQFLLYHLAGEHLTDLQQTNDASSVSNLIPHCSIGEQNARIWTRKHLFRFPVHNISHDTKHFFLTNMALAMGQPKTSCFLFRIRYSHSQAECIEHAQGSFPSQPVKYLKCIPDIWKGLACLWKQKWHLGKKVLFLIRLHKIVLRRYSPSLWVPKSVSSSGLLFFFFF